jgi:hypothetical protein
MDAIPTFGAREVPRIRDNTVHMWRSEMGDIFATTEAQRFIDPAATGARLSEELATSLSVAQLYWVAGDMGTLLGQARDAMPISTLATMDLPALHGLVVLEHPLTGMDAERDSDVTISAFTWSHSYFSTGVAGITIENYGPSSWLFKNPADRARMHGIGLGELAFIGGCNWPYATASDEFDPIYTNNATPGTRQSAIEDRQLLHAFFLLIAQKVTDVTVRTPDRQQRRAATRAGNASPLDVNVVTLRERTVDNPNAESGRVVEWSHRWMVRPHWRRQWYPSQGRHVPIFVPPHVKGPPGLPLVAKPTVRAWRR